MSIISVRASPGDIYTFMKAYVRVRTRAEAMRVKLTPAMIHYMTAVERGGPEAWVSGNVARKGGAVSRMWERLVGLGLATPAPHKLTADGRAALKAVPIKHQRITPASLQRMAHLGNHNRSRR
jgi:hypothetical protein